MLTDCAVCHVPDQGRSSVSQLLSDSKLTLELRFDDSVPEELRTPWRESLIERLKDTPVEFHAEPSGNAAPVRLVVSAEVAPARTNLGVDFHVARANAILTLHRARIELRSRPGVSVEEAEARERALDHLTDEVVQALSW